MCWAFTTSRVKPAGSRMLITGFQYTPVLSIATWVTPNSNSHSFQFCQRSCRRFELTGLTRYSGPLDCGYDYLLVYIQSATPVNDLGKFNFLIHCARILVRGQSYGNNFSFSLASASGHEDFI